MMHVLSNYNFICGKSIQVISFCHLHYCSYKQMFLQLLLSFFSLSFKVNEAVCQSAKCKVLCPEDSFVGKLNRTKLYS